MHIINLREKCEAIERPWSPCIVGELNGQHVKIALLDGEFIWHHHDDADELFLVLRGSASMTLKRSTNA